MEVTLDRSLTFKIRLRKTTANLRTRTNSVQILLDRTIVHDLCDPFRRIRVSLYSVFGKQSWNGFKCVGFSSVRGIINNVLYFAFKRMYFLLKKSSMYMFNVVYILQYCLVVYFTINNNTLPCFNNKNEFIRGLSRIWHKRKFVKSIR